MAMDRTEITIDAGRLEQELLALAKIGQHGETGVWRTAYSPEWLDAQNHILAWCQEAGFEARMDAAGNVWGTLAGTEPGKSVVSGSHIDSQKPGGRYDGTLGVLAALSAVRALARQFGRPRRTLEIVSLAEEESSRFPGSNFLGSRAILGKLSPQDAEELVGYEGETLAEAMRQAGLDPLQLPTAARDDIADFIELHIEQGPILEQAGVPVGIVTAINGIRHYVVELTGRSDHAGARPMAGRLDPVAGFAEIVTAVVGVALELGPPAVTTVGRVEVEPNLPAAVAERVTFTVDSRHPDPGLLAEQHARQEELMRAIAARRGLTIGWDVPLDLPPCVCDPGVVAALERAARAQGVPFRRMHSGAGHDTQNIARVARVAMVFARSKGGRSHTPAEFTSVDDAVAAAGVLAEALHELAY